MGQSHFPVLKGVSVTIVIVIVTSCSWLGLLVIAEPGVQPGFLRKSFDEFQWPSAPSSARLQFRNETVLYILFQPPHPPEFFEYYKVELWPPDAFRNTIYIPSSGGNMTAPQMGPGQVAFTHLVPGRLYNVSIRTVSMQRLSYPLHMRFRTAPLPVRNVELVPSLSAPNHLVLMWDDPDVPGDYDNFQVDLKTKEREPMREFTVAKHGHLQINLDSLMTFGSELTVRVKTMSGKMGSNATEMTFPPLYHWNWNNVLDEGRIYLHMAPRNSYRYDTDN